MRKVFLLSIFISILFLSNLVLAYLYDDFSGNTLDTTKWSEIASDGYYVHVDEYYLDPIEHNYHTKQDYPVDRGTILNIKNHSFLPGDIVEFDVNYINGSGNRLSRFNIDGVSLDEICPRVGSAHTCVIGYWNGESPVGNEFGLYHVKIIFNETTIDLHVTKPNGNVWSLTNIQLVSWYEPQKVFISPYSFEVESHTGHDGTLHFDYDNFTISQVQSPTATTTTTVIPCNCSELTQRIEDLKERVTLLEQWKNTIQSTIDSILTTLTNMLNILTNFEARISNLENTIMTTTTTSSTTTTIIGIKCWDGDNGYIRRYSSQLRKFCKCAEGTYGVLDSHSAHIKEGKMYEDTEDNENWETRWFRSFAADSIKCNDGYWYYTNQDHFR